MSWDSPVSAGGDDRFAAGPGLGIVYPDEAAGSERMARRVIARRWHHYLTDRRTGCPVGVLCRNRAGHAADLDLILPMLRPDPAQIRERPPAETRGAA